MSYFEKTIKEIVKEMIDNDKMGFVKKSKYVDFNFREDVDKIEAYKNSKHTSGSTDSLDRDKPFFNIVISAINIHYRATDIDRKNIKLRADKDTNLVLAFLETILLQEWMKKTEFGLFLNEWGLALAEYLEAVVKFVEKEGDLHAKVIPWTNLICDPIDFNNNPKIEKLSFTSAQLRKQKGYDKELVKNLIENKKVRETIEGTMKDTKDDYIELYEIHGEFSIANLKLSKGRKPLDSDYEEFVQQMHVISLGDSVGEGEEAYTLVSGEENDPYLLTSLKPNSDGSISLMGAVKQLFEAQWIVNDSEKSIKDHLDLTSKLFWQTADGNLASQNILESVETGQVILHTPNNPLTSLSNRPDTAAMENHKASWQQQGMMINGINEAMVSAPKSGTAWRQTQAILQESHNLFELFKQNKGLYVEKMLRKFVLPSFRKKLNNAKAISAILDEQQIKFIDSRYIPNEAIRRVNDIKKKTILSGEIYDVSQEGEQIASQEEFLQKSLNLKGQQRFIKPDEIEDKTWKEVLKDVENEIEVDVTGESKDIQSRMETYNTALTFLMSLQGRPLTPDEKLVFNRLLETSGDISPLELNQTQSQPQPAMQPQIA